MDARLYSSFVDGLAGETRALFDDEPRIATLLDAHARTVREAWPDLDVGPERFVGELARRLGADASVARLEAMKVADVYLAIACIDGDEAAITAFGRTLAKEVEMAATKTTATPDQIAEVTANLRRIVFVDEPPRPAALREFSGRGDLRSYVRVMAIRDLIRAVNRGRREVPTGDAELLDRIVPDHDPELSILRAQYRDVVDEAMRAAIATLDDRGRALLRYQLVEKWNVDQVGRAYGVHRATAARWIAAVRDELGDKIRSELAKRLRVAVDEVDSIVRLVQSRVDVSLDRVLGKPERS